MQKRVIVAGLRSLSLESPACKVGTWLVCGNVDFRRVPLIPRTDKRSSLYLNYLHKPCEVKWKSLSRVWLFATPWAIQSMEFSRPEYWSGSLSLLQGIFPTQGPNPGLPHCRRTNHVVYRKYLLSFLESYILEHARQGCLPDQSPVKTLVIFLGWQHLHTCCHKPLLEELSMSCVTPLGKRALSSLCLVSSRPHPLSLSLSWFCWLSFCCNKSEQWA